MTYSFHSWTAAIKVNAREELKGLLNNLIHIPDLFVKYQIDVMRQKDARTLIETRQPLKLLWQVSQWHCMIVIAESRLKVLTKHLLNSYYWHMIVLYPWPSQTLQNMGWF